MLGRYGMRVLGSLAVAGAVAAFGALRGCPSGPPTVGDLTDGGPIQGRLEEGDQVLDQTGEFADFYKFHNSSQGAFRRRLHIHMTSGEFSPYVFIRGPNGFQEDLGQEGSETHMTVELPLEGDYVICATSHRRGEAGAYTIWTD